MGNRETGDVERDVKTQKYESSLRAITDSSSLTVSTPAALGSRNYLFMLHAHLPTNAHMTRKTRCEVQCCQRNFVSLGNHALTMKETYPCLGIYQADERKGGGCNRTGKSVEERDESHSGTRSRFLHCFGGGDSTLKTCYLRSAGDDIVRDGLYR